MRSVLKPLQCSPTYDIYFLAYLSSSFRTIKRFYLYKIMLVLVFNKKKYIYTRKTNHESQNKYPKYRFIYLFSLHHDPNHHKSYHLINKNWWASWHRCYGLLLIFPCCLWNLTSSTIFQYIILLLLRILNWFCILRFSFIGMQFKIYLQRWCPFAKIWFSATSILAFSIYSLCNFSLMDAWYVISLQWMHLSCYYI